MIEGMSELEIEKRDLKKKLIDEWAAFDKLMSPTKDEWMRFAVADVFIQKIGMGELTKKNLRKSVKVIVGEGFSKPSFNEIYRSFNRNYGILLNY